MQFHNHCQEGRINLDKEKRKASFLKLDALVKAKGTNFYKLAKHFGWANSIFSDWKSGKSMPKTDKLLKLAEYFGVTVDYFLIS
mgnify:CR=1 FL=1